MAASIYLIIYSGATLLQRVRVLLMDVSRNPDTIEMLTIPDDDLRRWLAEDVPYGDLTTHALGFGNRHGRIRFEARQAMVAACSEEAGRIIGARRRERH